MQAVCLIEFFVSFWTLLCALSDYLCNFGCNCDLLHIVVLCSVVFSCVQLCSALCSGVLL